MDVLLLIADSLRAHNTSLHNYERQTTPFFEELAKESVVFEKAIAPSVWSLPSHASMFTGLQAEEHHLFGTDAALGDHKTIWEELQSSGYSTGVFSGNPFITEPEYGLTEGFGTIKPDPEAFQYPLKGINPDNVEFPNNVGPKVAYLRAATRSENLVGSVLNGILYYIQQLLDMEILERQNRLVNWIKSQSGPWAACVNLMTTHYSYKPSEEFDYWSSPDDWDVQDNLQDHRWSFYSGDRRWSEKEQLMNLYDGAIREVDSEIEHIYRYLKQSGTLDDTLLIVTGDHGECFGEYSTIRPNIHLADHTTGIHDHQVHVPLLVRPPGGRSETISDPVSLTGLYDVIRSVLNRGVDIGALTNKRAVSSVDTNRRIIYGGDDADEFIEDWGIDTSSFEGFSRALYVKEGGSIQRYATWGDDTEPMNLPDEIIEMMTYPNQNISVAASSDGATQRRLKDLGYL